MANKPKKGAHSSSSNYIGFFTPHSESAKLYWNRFCWFCHGEGSSIKRHCTKCSHAYHVDCFGTGTDTICRHCAANQFQNDPFNSDGSKMLRFLIDKIFSDNEFVMFDSQHIRKPLTQISAKIDDYRNFASFLDDIKWTVHKYYVVFGESKMSTTAERLLMFCVDQVDSMQACAECYINSCEQPNRHMVMVCSAAHSVLWSRLSPDSHYWPAKLMTAQNPKVTVRFFGHHSTAQIALTDCLMYSLDYPKETGDGVLLLDRLDAALKEANTYIENLQQTVGTFTYSTANTPLGTLTLTNRDEHHTTGVIAQSTAKAPSTNGTETKYSYILQSLNKPNSIRSTSTTVSSSNVRIKSEPSTDFVSSGTKRSAGEPLATSQPKARKTFPTPINLEIVSGFLKLNPNNLFHKNNRQVGELEMTKKQLELEINKQKSEIKQLKTNNQQLATKMNGINASWEAKLKATERKYSCISCGTARQSPYYCSKICQMEYWKKQTYEQYEGEQ